jgi:hypothetical protein
MLPLDLVLPGRRWHRPQRMIGHVEIELIAVDMDA